MKIESRPGGKDIEAWQLARELTRKVYRLTKKPRFAEDYGLKRQIQVTTQVQSSGVHGSRLENDEPRPV
jgi:hypothetical protein